MVVASVTHSITNFIGSNGVYAVFVLMMIDAVFPAASELVMAYGGALAAGAFAGQTVTLFGKDLGSGIDAYVAICLAGTIGYLVGSWIGWAIGYFGGRPLLVRHGRWFHLDEAKLDRAERWFARWEDWAVLIGRVTPLVRLDPGGRLRGAPRPLHGADAGRLGDLGVRDRRRRLRPRHRLRALRP